MDSKVPLSVVIATFNRCYLLAQTLPTVFEQDLPLTQYEVIVVVDGSTDGTIELLETFPSRGNLRTIKQANEGQAMAINVGLKAARGKIVLFLDDDILCDRSLLREHLSAHRDFSSAVVFGPVYVASESPRTLATDWTKARTDGNSRFLTRQGEARWPWVSAGNANTSVASSTLLRCGGLDEQLSGAYDDRDLGLRLWKMKVRFWYRPTAVAYQIYVKSDRVLVRDTARRYGRNEIWLCRKHPEYRCHSVVGRLATGPWWKRLARQIAVRSTVSPEPLLRLPYFLAERFRSIPWIRHIGIRFLQGRMGIELFRSAKVELGSWEALRCQFGLRLPVLGYHNVARPMETDPHPELTVSPRQFEHQVRWLVRQGYIGIRPSDWWGWCSKGKTLPKKPVLFTFDDAYADITEHALPVLRHYGFSGAVFVITSQVGGTTAWDGKRIMTAAQVREWAMAGFEFGSHSRSHPDLTISTTPELINEVTGSREDLEHLLGSKAVSFAYPFGCYNQSVTETVRASFPVAFTCEEGLNELQTEPCLLRRTEVRPQDSQFAFQSRVYLGWSVWAALRMRVGLRSRFRAAIRRIRAHLKG